MKALTQEQIKILLMIIDDKDDCIGNPTHLAMDDDGDLRSYFGKPNKNGQFWGDFSTPPYDSYDEDIKNVLNFIKIGHKEPYELSKLILYKEY